VSKINFDDHVVEDIPFFLRPGNLCRDRLNRGKKCPHECPLFWVQRIESLSTFSAHFVWYISESNKYLNFQVQSLKCLFDTTFRSDYVNISKSFHQNHYKTGVFSNYIYITFWLQYSDCTSDISKVLNLNTFVWIGSFYVTFFKRHY